MYSPITGLYWPNDLKRPTLFELARHALRPVNLEVIIEPSTGDRVFFLELADHAPLVIRQTAEDIIRARLKLLIAEARSLH